MTYYFQPIPAEGSVTDAHLPFFEVGRAKFAVMSIVTFGFYDLYWAYQQWTRIKARSGEKLIPSLRAAFAHVWGFSLFAHVRAEAVQQGVTVEWSAGLLGLCYLLIGALWRLPDPWWLISFLSFAVLIPVVNVIAALHERIDGQRDRNARFSIANMVGTAIGSLLVLLVLAGVFLK